MAVDIRKKIYEDFVDTILFVDNKELWSIFCGESRSCRSRIRPSVFVEFCDEFRFSNKINGYIVDIHI